MEITEINDFLRQRIREIRITKKLAQKQVAERAGLPKSSYSSIETGAYRLTIATLYKILLAIGADISDIWPPIWEGSYTVSDVTTLPEVNRLNWFRLREIFVHSAAASVCLIFQKGNLTEFLSWVNVTQDERKLLLEAILYERKAEGWEIITKKEGHFSIHLCLREPIIEDFLEKLAHVYLSLWLAAKLF